MVATTSFSEHRVVSVSEPLRQGDVLERASEEATPWNRNLLVITADCDFAHGKHQGRVTCVPLLTKEEYLLELQMPRIREQVKAKLLKACRDSIGAFGAPLISDARLTAWPTEQPADQILNDLGIAQEDGQVTRALLDAIKLVQEVPASVEEAVATLVDAQACLPNSRSVKNLTADLIDRLQGAFKQPPGDALFISSLADGYDHGYFAYLRHLEQIWQPEIALGPSRAHTEYRRISRLRETYTHALAQRFALVYMSIGLPTEYEEIRDLHAELLEGALL